MSKENPGARTRAAVADGRSMAKIRDFKETVAARMQSDPAFAPALSDAAITLLVNGEPESTRLILRDLVNASVGFEALADEIHKPAKSRHRMLPKSGDPIMTNASAIFAAIERALKARPEGRRPRANALTDERPRPRQPGHRLRASDPIRRAPGCR